MQKTIAQLKTVNTATFGAGKDTLGDDEKAFNEDQLDSVKPLERVVSASQTAILGETYIVVASATFTDPSPVEGKGFSVFVRNGTATVGGTAYSQKGTIINRIFHSGSWANYSIPISVSFRVELTASDLFNGVTKDIPELPALGAGFAWSLYNAELSYSFGTEQYDATDVFVQPQGQRHQYNAETAINDASESFFIGMVRNNCGLNQAVTIAENTKMQIKVESTSTTGDGTAVVYGIARLITV